MFTILMTLFVISCMFLAFFILLQQGKGDLGLGSMGGSRQMLFGGSGGQEFFEKITWTLGIIFIVGALGLSIMKSRAVRRSRLEESYTAATTALEETKKASGLDTKATQADEENSQDNEEEEKADD